VFTGRLLAVAAHKGIDRGVMIMFVHICENQETLQSFELSAAEMVVQMTVLCSRYTAVIFAAAVNQRVMTVVEIM